MPVTSPISAAKKIYWDKFVPDIIMLLLYFFCLNPLMAWQQQHLALSCTLLMLLNCMAVGLGCYTFFTAYADTEAMIKYKNSLSSFESAALGLSAFISCLAFFWWLVPFTAVKKMGVKETGFIAGAVVYFITFMGVVAASVNSKKKISNKDVIKVRAVNTILTTAFFFFSYGFLVITLENWQPGFIAAPYLAIICLFIFYLPLRFFLLLRPPFSKLEYISFVLSFGILMLQLFMRTE